METASAVCYSDVNVPCDVVLRVFTAGVFYSKLTSPSILHLRFNRLSANVVKESAFSYLKNLQVLDIGPGSSGPEDDGEEEEMEEEEEDQ